MAIEKFKTKMTDGYGYTVIITLLSQDSKQVEQHNIYTRCKNMRTVFNNFVMGNTPPAWAEKALIHGFMNANHARSWECPDYHQRQLETYKAKLLPVGKWRLLYQDLMA